ncbi:MAG: PKD domain-containing protein [Thermoplasmata archaeon]
MSRTPLLTAVVAIVVVAIMSGGFVAAAQGVGLPISGTPSGSAHPASDATPAGTALLQKAVANLNAGAARSGSTATCAVSSGTAATCGGSAPRDITNVGDSARKGPAAAMASPAHTPTLSGTDPSWYNVTTNVAKASGGVVPAIGYGARMAFDPLLGEVVLFSGTGVENPNNPYESITWVYNGDTWTNLTSTLGHTVPSARWFFGFDYDPAMGGVILVGGWNVDGLGLNDTWLFTGTWKNITGTTGPLLDNLRHYLAEGGIGGSGAAWDPALHGFLLVDGCDDNSCDYSQEYTWLLNSTGWHTIDYGPGYLADGTFLDEPGMAYDPVDGYMVLFGGWDFYTEYPYTNYTYTYSGGTEFADNWVNITGMDGGCALGCTPPGRSDIAITWDAQLGGVFLTAGYNATYGEYNDSWEFLAGHWHAISPAAPASYVPLEGPALAVNSTGIGVFLVGGSCYFPVNCDGHEWVFETPPQATLTATPNPMDLGTAVTFTAAWAVGTGTGWYAGWNLSTGDGMHTLLRAAAGESSSAAYSEMIPYTYGTSGAFTATVTWSDFFYIEGTSSGVSLTVNPVVAATITASATTITAGGAVTFTTSPTGGSGTYTYAWSFGDATTSTAQDPAAHTYARAGNYVVNLTVTDTVGGTAKNSVTITVSAAPSPGPSPSPSSSSGLSGATLTYLIVGVVVVLVVIVAAVLLMRRRKKPTTTQPGQPNTAPTGPGSPPPAS